MSFSARFAASANYATTPTAGTVTNFPDLEGEFQEGGQTKTVTPSKLLGVGIEIGGESFFVIVAHLISKRSSNDPKRLGQADAIRNAVLAKIGGFDHVIVMGDLNDLPDSPPLRRVRGFDDSGPVFIQTGRTSGPDPSFSFIFQGNKQLIDHILLSPSLQTAFSAVPVGQRHVSIDLGPISDHFAVSTKIVLP